MSNTLYKFLIDLSHALKCNKLYISSVITKSIKPLLIKLYKKGYISYYFYLNKNKILSSIQLETSSKKINFIKIISTPQKPVYVSYNTLIKLRKDFTMGDFILSTSKGIYLSNEIIKNKSGGVLLAWII